MDACFKECACVQCRFNKPATNVSNAVKKIQNSNTKVFLRSHAYELIEQLRHESMDKAAIKIQAAGRRRLHRNEFRSLRECSLLMQCALRKIIAERVVSHVRRNHNSTKIQSSTHMSLCR